MSRDGSVLTFAQALGGWDDGRLTSLLVLRPDLTRPIPKSLAALVERAANWMSVQQCRLDLDRGAQQVLDAVCLLAEPRTLGSLVSMLGGPDRTGGLGGALDRLEGRALVLRAGERLIAAPGIGGFSYPARLGPPAASALASYHAAALTAMARKLGVRPGGTRASALAAVCGAISDPQRLRLVLSSGPADCARVAHLAANEGPLITARNGVYALSDRNPAGWLASHGVLAPMSWDTLVMPREVALALRGGTPFPNLELTAPETRTETVDPGAVDSVAAERALRLVGDVRALLDLWGQAAPAVLKDGGIGVREIRRAAKVIDRTEADAALVIELAAAAGLVTLGRPGGEVLPLPQYDAWLAMEVPQRWERLAQGWLGAGLHLSLAGGLDHKDKVIPALLDRSPEKHAAGRRDLVLRILTAAPIGEAVTAASLGALADWSAPDVWAGGPASPARLRSWLTAEAEALGVVALGALSSFGRLAVLGWVGPTGLQPAGKGAPGPVAAPGSAGPSSEGPGSAGPDSAGSRSAGPGSAGPSSAAAALSAWAPAVSTTFVLQADLTAVAPGELTSTVRNELELLADVESKGAATVYRFSEASLRRAFDAGRTSAEITAFLDSHATRGVPQALAYLVGDLDRRFGSLRVGGTSCYLRCEDPALIAEILAARRNAKLGLRQLAPTVLVSSSPPEATLSLLRSNGYLPALESGDGGLVIVDVSPQRALAPIARPWGRSEVDPESVISVLRKASGPAGAPASKEQQEDRSARFPIPGLPPGMSDSSAAVLMDLLGGMWEDPGQAFDEDQMDEVLDEPGGSGVRTTSAEGPSPRPVTIVRGPGPVMDVLRRAYVQDWMVRVGYIGGSGRPSQINCVLVALDDDAILVESEPRWEARALLPDRIDWVRVLTEAEEEMLA